MSTTKYVAIVAVFVLGAVASAPAIGAQFVYEGFSSEDYTNGTEIQYVTDNPGTGWGGNWNAVSGTTYQSTDFFGDNSPAGGTSDRIGGSANKAGGNTSDVWRSTMDLSDKFQAGDTVWFSYLVAARHNIDNQFNIGFASSTAYDSGIGISFVPNSSNELIHGRVDGTLSTTSISAPLNSDGFNTNGNNLSYFVVGEFVKGSDPDTDSLRLWVNEGTELPSAATFEFSDFSLAATPDRFGFNDTTVTLDGGGSAQVAVWFDEIKMGASMDDIGVIPEPSTLALLGLSGLLLMRRRRR